MRRSTGRHALLAFALVSLGISPAKAALVSLSGTVSITNSPSLADFNVGDIFTFSLTYDDSVADSDSATDAGTFTGALTAFTFTRSPANVGAWDPSSGTFSLPFELYTQPGTMVFSAEGSGFPTIGANPFQRIYVSIPLLSVSDTGLGQTLAQQLGGIATWNNLGDQGGWIEATSEASFDVTSFGPTAVPEPGSAALAILGAALLLVAHVGRRFQPANPLSSGFSRPEGRPSAGRAPQL